MKSNRSSYILIFIFTIILSTSCSMPQSSIITVQNKSGKIVSNIKIVINASYGEIIKNIECLEINEITSINVELTEFKWGIGAGVYAATFSIEYTIDDVLFDIKNDEDIIEMIYNNNAVLSDGKEKIVVINEESYKIE